MDSNRAAFFQGIHPFTGASLGFKPVKAGQPRETDTPIQDRLETSPDHVIDPLNATLDTLRRVGGKLSSIASNWQENQFRLQTMSGNLDYASDNLRWAERDTKEIDSSSYGKRAAQDLSEAERQFSLLRWDTDGPRWTIRDMRADLSNAKAQLSRVEARRLPDQQRFRQIELGLQSFQTMLITLETTQSQRERTVTNLENPLMQLQRDIEKVSADHPSSENQEGTDVSSSASSARYLIRDVSERIREGTTALGNGGRAVSQASELLREVQKDIEGVRDGFRDAWYTSDGKI